MIKSKYKVSKKIYSKIQHQKKHPQLQTTQRYCEVVFFKERRKDLIREEIKKQLDEDDLLSQVFHRELINPALRVSTCLSTGTG